MTNSNGSCAMGKMIFGIIIFAVAIQLFFILVAIAVASGNDLPLIFAIHHMLSWPIYFMSLALAVVLAAVRCLKSCSRSQSCCSTSQDCQTSSKACSTPTQSCCPSHEGK
jgi:hypothetical protein